MGETAGEHWETCQIEREEQTGFFGSTVVYTAVTTDRSGHRQVVATETVNAAIGVRSGVDTPGWTPLAERLEAAGWERVAASRDGGPTFRRRWR